MSFKDRMIEAYERGECTYEGSYDYVRDSMADMADRRRKAEREGAGPSPRAQAEIRIEEQYAKAVERPSDKP